MTLNAQMGHLLIHTVYVKPQSGVSNSGMPTYGSKTSKLARVERTNELVVSLSGNEQRAGHVMVTLSEVDQNSLVWFPGDDDTNDNEARRPIAKTQADTTSGYTLYETYF